jgi:hypothetical protein
MTRIRLFESPFTPVGPRLFEAESLAHWLLDHYGDAPRVTVQIFAGEPSSASEISHDAEAILANDCDEYVVLQSPGVPAAWIPYVIAAVMAVAAMVLMPKPVMPGNVNRTQQSPNNSLGQRENKVRLLERVEDIYGTVLSIPSLMMPTYTKYIGHRKFEYGYYCVGRGYYDIDEVQDGDTLISDIRGASAAFYEPFTSPNSGAPVLQIGDAIIDGIISARRATEVDGITLKALNQLQMPLSGTYTFDHGNRLTQLNKEPNFNAVTAVGDQLTISGAGKVVVTSGSAGFVSATKTVVDSAGVGLFSAIAVGDVVTVAGTVSNNGSRTVTARPNASTMVVAETVVDEDATTAGFSALRDFSGTYEVSAVDDGYVELMGLTWPASYTASGARVQLPDVSDYTDWVTLPGKDRTEVWCNVVAPTGMFRDDGGKTAATVTFAIEIEQLTASLVPTGVVEVVAGSLTGAVQDERAETIERRTAWTGPARVRMRRVSQYDYAFKGTIVDEIKWQDLYAVSPVDRPDFGNKTTVHTVTQATARATTMKTRQLNCLASRRLPLYDGVTFSGSFDAAGRHVAGTIAATSRLVDIIAAVALDPLIGRRDLVSEVDMRQIWSVQQQLDAWRPDVGQFNFTFDSDNTSFEEAVIMIANAGFCIAYRQNGKIRLSLDRAQPASTALFTHRNKKPNSETITRAFASDSDYDGVEFVYVDPDSLQSETITLPVDGSHTKAKKFEIPGIRNFAQAWLRANREYQKLLGQRITIESSTTSDARALLPNARVDIVDNTRFKSYDGEVVGQSGLELTLSQDVVFTPGLPHSIVLMRRDGSLEGILCHAGSATNRVILQALPSEALVTTFGREGIRTIYSFAADSARGAMAYLVQEIDLSDAQYPTIRAINYSDSYFSADYMDIPARESIIN